MRESNVLTGLTGATGATSGSATRPVSRHEKLVEDYRKIMIVDPDNPVLAFKAYQEKNILPNRVSCMEIAPSGHNS